MEAVEKGSDVDAAQKEKSSVGRFLTFFLAAILGGAIVAGFVAVTNGIVPARNEAAVQSSKKKVGSDFGGLEDVVFEFPSSSISKRQEASSCVSNISKDTLPSAQIVGAKPPFFFGMRTRNGCSYTPEPSSTIWMKFTALSQFSHLQGLGIIDTGKVTALHITQCGHYHVYSQITWSDIVNKNKNNNNGMRYKNSIQHSTMLLTNNGCRDDQSYFPQLISPLLTYTKEFDDGTVTTVTSVQSGTFLLCAGDRIFVQISTNTRSCISYDGQKTFFGAHKV